MSIKSLDLTVAIGAVVASPLTGTSTPMSEASERIDREVAGRLERIFQGASLDRAIQNTEYLIKRRIGLFKHKRTLELLKIAKEIRDAKEAGSENPQGDSASRASEMESGGTEHDDRGVSDLPEQEIPQA